MANGILPGHTKGEGWGLMRWLAFGLGVYVLYQFINPNKK